jgi:DNA-binding response OmpR family regulator
MSPRLLIADDEESILFAMKEYFETLGYEVDCARRVHEAHSLLELHSYAVVICDLRLTPSEPAAGLDLVGAIRERHPGTRTIILTAYGSPRVEELARGLGVDAFLHKTQRLKEVAVVVRWLTDGQGGPVSAH